jgi:hypothetical protein
MLYRDLAGLRVAVVVALACVACSDKSPIAPGITSAAVPSSSAKAQAVPGSYELSLFLSGPELILKAHVADAVSGAPAQGGTVTFQYCSLKGGPTLQMKPLPSAECESGGSGTWVRLAKMTVNPSGDAFVDFGIAPSIATVGFRFLYSGQQGGIASGVSAPVDFVP